MNELKLCPFCGGEARYFVFSNSRSYLAAHVVSCLKCKKRVQGVSKVNVIEKWNRRVDNEAL